MKTDTLIYTILLACFLIFFVVTKIIAASTPFSQAENILLEANYTDPECTKNHYMFGGFHGCDGESIAMECTATNSSGQRINLMVCQGVFFKGATIRHK